MLCCCCYVLTYHTGPVVTCLTAVHQSHCDRSIKSQRGQFVCLSQNNFDILPWTLTAVSRPVSRLHSEWVSAVMLWVILMTMVSVDDSRVEADSQHKTAGLLTQDSWLALRDYSQQMYWVDSQWQHHNSVMSISIIIIIIIVMICDVKCRSDSCTSGSSAW